MFDNREATKNAESVPRYLRKRNACITFVTSICIWKTCRRASPFLQYTAQTEPRLGEGVSHNPTESNKEEIMKKLVAFFSASGTTKALAERLAKVAGADLVEIKPTVPYTRDDLDWTNKNSRSTLEMKDPASRPEMQKITVNPGEYDTVYLGFPIWWYVAPTIIDTFLESADFSGKKIIPFATSGGSGMGKTVETLKKVCPNANWQSGAVIKRMSDSALAEWVEKNDRA